MACQLGVVQALFDALSNHLAVRCSAARGRRPRRRSETVTSARRRAGDCWVLVNVHIAHAVGKVGLVRLLHRTIVVLAIAVVVVVAVHMVIVLTVTASVFVVVVTVVAAAASRLDVVVEETIGLGDRRPRLVLLWRVCKETRKIRDKGEVRKGLPTLSPVAPPCESEPCRMSLVHRTPISGTLSTVIARRANSTLSIF